MNVAYFSLAITSIASSGVLPDLTHNEDRSPYISADFTFPTNTIRFSDNASRINFVIICHGGSPF